MSLVKQNWDDIEYSIVECHRFSNPIPLGNQFYSMSKQLYTDYKELDAEFKKISGKQLSEEETKKILAKIDIFINFVIRHTNAYLERKDLKAIKSNESKKDKKDKKDDLILKHALSEQEKKKYALAQELNTAALNYKGQLKEAAHQPKFNKSGDESTLDIDRELLKSLKKNDLVKSDKVKGTVLYRRIIGHGVGPGVILSRFKLEYDLIVTLEGGMWGSSSVDIRKSNYGTYCIAKDRLSLSAWNFTVVEFGIISVYITILNATLAMGNKIITVENLLNPGIINKI